MTTLLTSLMAILLSGCHMKRAFSYPFEYTMYHLNGKYPDEGTRLAEQTKQDMLSCGFRNTSNNTGYMTLNEGAKASICMDRKGYLIDGKKNTCDTNIYRNTETCKNLN